jgi:hypothetical protein
MPSSIAAMNIHGTNTTVEYSQTPNKTWKWALVILVPAGGQNVQVRWFKRK